MVAHDILSGKQKVLSSPARFETSRRRSQWFGRVVEPTSDKRHQHGLPAPAEVLLADSEFSGDRNLRPPVVEPASERPARGALEVTGNLIERLAKYEPYGEAFCASAPPKRAGREVLDRRELDERARLKRDRVVEAA